MGLPQPAGLSICFLGVVRHILQAPMCSRYLLQGLFISYQLPKNQWLVEIVTRQGNDALAALVFDRFPDRREENAPTLSTTRQSMSKQDSHNLVEAFPGRRPQHETEHDHGHDDVEAAPPARGSLEGPRVGRGNGTRAWCLGCPAAKALFGTRNMSNYS